MKRLYALVCKTEIVAAAFCFCTSCVLIFFAAIARTFNHPINWSQDLSLFLFAWSVFLSADAALRADKLVNVDLLVGRFSARTKRIVSIANYIVILVFLAALLWFGVKLCLISRNRVFQGIPGFSYLWVNLSIPVGSLLLGITAVGKLRNLVSSRPAGFNSEAVS
jgi:TRAP-type C4-dicarboxylate transport system permease small subunit